MALDHIYAQNVIFFAQIAISSQIEACENNHISKQ